MAVSGSVPLRQECLEGDGESTLAENREQGDRLVQMLESSGRRERAGNGGRGVCIYVESRAQCKFGKRERHLVCPVEYLVSTETGWRKGSPLGLDPSATFEWVKSFHG